MRIALDATPLIFFINATVGLDRNRVSDDEPDDLDDRMKYLLETAQHMDWKIVVPAPALAEALVRAPHTQRVIRLFQESPVFEIAPFGSMEVVQLVEMEQTARESGDKRGGLGTDVHWQKVKLDRQIIAAAMSRRCNKIVTADRNVLTLVDRLHIEGQHLFSLPTRPDPEFPLLDQKSQRMIEGPDK